MRGVACYANGPVTSFKCQEDSGMMVFWRLVYSLHLVCQLKLDAFLRYDMTTHTQPNQTSGRTSIPTQIDLILINSISVFSSLIKHSGRGWFVCVFYSHVTRNCGTLQVINFIEKRPKITVNINFYQCRWKTGNSAQGGKFKQ